MVFKISKRFFAALTLLVLLFALGACQLKPARQFNLKPARQTVRGSGAISSETDINAHMRGQEWALRIDDIYLTFGNSGTGQLIVDETFEFAGKLETDTNLGLRLNYNLNRKEIILRGDKNKIYFPTQLIIKIGVPVNRLIINGALNIEYNCPGMSDFTMDINGAAKGDFIFGSLNSLNINLNGTSSIKMRGAAKHAAVTLNGASNVAAFDLLAEAAKVTINGASKCEITASKTLDATVNGLGSIIYDGSPQVIKAIHGLGEVRKR